MSFRQKFTQLKELVGARHQVAKKSASHAVDDAILRRAVMEGPAVATAGAKNYVKGIVSGNTRGKHPTEAVIGGVADAVKRGFSDTSTKLKKVVNKEKHLARNLTIGTGLAGGAFLIGRRSDVKMSARDKLNSIIEFKEGKGHDWTGTAIHTAAVGGGLHVGGNAVIKRALVPGTGSQRFATSIFNKGVTDAAAGKQLHPMVQRASDALLGPEWSHIYDAGHKSTPEARANVQAVGKEGGSVGKGLAGIVGGKNSSWTDKVMSHLPTADAGRVAKKRDWIGAAAASAVGAVVDPTVPVVNITRTVASKMPIGNRILRNEAKKGAMHGPQKGIGRTLSDYVMSPSMNIARDAGHEVAEAAKGGKLAPLAEAGHLGEEAKGLAGDLKSGNLMGAATKAGKMSAPLKEPIMQTARAMVKKKFGFSARAKLDEIIELSVDKTKIHKVKLGWKSKLAATLLGTGLGGGFIAKSALNLSARDKLNSIIEFREPRPMPEDDNMTKLKKLAAVGAVLGGAAFIGVNIHKASKQLPKVVKHKVKLNRAKFRSSGFANSGSGYSQWSQAQPRPSAGRSAPPPPPPAPVDPLDIPPEGSGVKTKHWGKLAADVRRKAHGIHGMMKRGIEEGEIANAKVKWDRMRQQFGFSSKEAVIEFIRLSPQLARLDLDREEDEHEEKKKDHKKKPIKMKDHDHHMSARDRYNEIIEFARGDQLKRMFKGTKDNPLADAAVDAFTTGGLRRNTMESIATGRIAALVKSAGGPDKLKKIAQSKGGVEKFDKLTNEIRERADRFRTLSAATHARNKANPNAAAEAQAEINAARMKRSGNTDAPKYKTREEIKAAKDKKSESGGLFGGEDTPLKKYGAYGAGAAAAGLGYGGYRLLRKDRQEQLSARLDDVIEFARGDQLLKRLAGSGGKASLATEEARALIGAAKRNPKMLDEGLNQAGRGDLGTNEIRNSIAQQVKASRKAGGPLNYNPVAAPNAVTGNMKGVPYQPGVTGPVSPAPAPTPNAPYSVPIAPVMQPTAAGPNAITGNATGVPYTATGSPYRSVTPTGPNAVTGNAVGTPVVGTGSPYRPPVAGANPVTGNMTGTPYSPSVAAANPVTGNMTGTPYPPPAAGNATPVAFRQQSSGYGANLVAQRPAPAPAPVAPPAPAAIPAVAGPQQQYTNRVIKHQGEFRAHQENAAKTYGNSVAKAQKPFVPPSYEERMAEGVKRRNAAKGTPAPAPKAPGITPKGQQPGNYFYHNNAAAGAAARSQQRANQPALGSPIDARKNVKKVGQPATVFTDPSKVIEFRGGYVNTEDGVRYESGAGGHFDRNQGIYTGTILMPIVGTGAGYLIDQNRRKKNLLRTRLEEKIPEDIVDQIAMGPRQFQARFERLIYFAADPRDRNRLGEFTAGDDGPSPDNIHTTYKQQAPPPLPLGPRLGATAVGAAAGGAGSYLGIQAIKKLIEKIKK